MISDVELNAIRKQVNDPENPFAVARWQVRRIVARLDATEQAARDATFSTVNDLMPENKRSI